MMDLDAVHEREFRMVAWHGYVYLSGKPNHPITVVGIIYLTDGSERIWYVKTDGHHIDGSEVRSAYLKRAIR